MRLLHFISKRVQQCFSIKLMKKKWKTEKNLISGCFSYTPAGCCLHELISTLLKISWSILNSRSTNVMIFFVVITKCVIKRVILNVWLNSIKIFFLLQNITNVSVVLVLQKTQVLLHEWPSWHKNSRGTAIEKQKSHYRKEETIPMTRNIAVLFLRIGKH